MKFHEKIYIRAPDWWPERVLEEHALLLMRVCTGHARPLGNGMYGYPHGWRIMVMKQ
jgi:hypothetical protein